jgi:hypothetical protein
MTEWIVFECTAGLVVVALFLWFWRRRSVYRDALPRVFELCDLILDPAVPSAYFRDFEKTLDEWPAKRKQFCDIEKDLQGLDDESWRFLKKEVAPLLIAKDSKRGWQPLFDILNHAKAFNYLKRTGYANIRFIQVSRVSGQRTPDIEAELASSKVLCEVKTINISEIEASRRRAGGVGTIQFQLDGGFFGKLASDLKQAEAQMKAYCADETAKRMVYVVVNFDDSLHEYADSYRSQIDQHMAAKATPGLDVIFDIKPPFYSAMS